MAVPAICSSAAYLSKLHPSTAEELHHPMVDKGPVDLEVIRLYLKEKVVLKACPKEELEEQMKEYFMVIAIITIAVITIASIDSIVASIIMITASCALFKP